MTNWKTYKKLADQLLGIKKEGNLLVNGYQSYSYQYKYAETKQLSDNYPYTERESETVLQLRQDIQNRIVEIAKEVATPTQLIYLNEFLQLNKLTSVANKLGVNVAMVSKTILSQGPYGGLAKKVKKQLLIDKKYLELKNKLEDILE